MITKISGYAGVLAVLLVGGQAVAGGLTETAAEPPVVAPVEAQSDWTGFYAGAQIGMADAEVSFAPNSFLKTGSGAALGLHAGYNYDFGSFVLGAEVDFDTLDLDIGEPDVRGGGTIADWIARFKVRAGYDLGQTLIYGTAGFAQIRFDESTDPNPANESFTANGHVFGFGVAHQLTPNMVLSGEVLRHDFDDLDNTPGLNSDVTTASVRLSLRF